MNVSVVVPVFNGEQWLGDTLTSIQKQGVDLELIVVDDGSVDGSVDIARSFLAESGLPGEVLTSERNAGPGPARNRGWARAGAEWVQFLDADDLIAPDKLSVQWSRATAVPAGVAVVYSPWQHYRLVGGRWGPDGPLVRSEVDVDPVAAILRDRQFGYVGPTLIRRAALEAVGGFSPRMTLGEDFDLMLRLAMAGFAFHQVDSPTPLFFYRENPVSLWHSSVVDLGAVTLLLESIRAADTHLRGPADAPVSEATRRAIAGRYIERLGTLDDQDRAGFERVVGWIAELHLRTGQEGAHPAVQAAAAVVGLGTALRLKFAAGHVARLATSKLRTGPGGSTSG